MYIYSCLKMRMTYSDFSLKKSSWALRDIFFIVRISVSSFFSNDSTFLPIVSILNAVYLLSACFGLLDWKPYPLSAFALFDLMRFSYFLNRSPKSLKKSSDDLTELRSSELVLCLPKLKFGLLIPLSSRSDSISRSFSSMELSEKALPLQKARSTS